MQFDDKNIEFSQKIWFTRFEFMIFDLRIVISDFKISLLYSKITAILNTPLLNFDYRFVIGDFEILWKDFSAIIYCTKSEVDFNYKKCIFWWYIAY